MPVNYLAIAVQTGVIVLLLGLVCLYVRYRVIPKLEKKTRQGVGLAIGAWMKGLSEEAEKEGVEGGDASRVLNLGGFKFDLGMVKELAPLIIEYGPKLLVLAKQFGLVKGEGASGFGTL